MDASKENPFRFPRVSGRSVGNHHRDKQALSPPHQNVRVLSPAFSESSSTDLDTSASATSTPTVNETKKMGKFKFLTIPSMDIGSTTVNIAAAGDAHFPTSHQINGQNSMATRTSTPPVVEKKSLYHITQTEGHQTSTPLSHSFQPSCSPHKSKSSRSSPANSTHNSRLLPSYPKNQEELFIEQQVKRLLKVTADSLDRADIAEEEVEEEDDDFDTRLERMIAEEEQNQTRKRGRGGRGGGRGTRGGAAAVAAASVAAFGGGVRRMSGRRKTETVADGPSIEEPAVDTMPNEMRPNIPVVDVIEPVIKVKGKRGRKKKVVPPPLSVIAEPPVEVTSTNLSNDQSSSSPREPESEDTGSQVSDSLKEEDPPSVLKPKSRWVEKSAVVQPVVTPSNGEQEQQQEPDSTTNGQTPDADVSLTDSEGPTGYIQISECERLTKRSAKDDKEARKMRCECQYSEEDAAHGYVGCGKECMNRMIYIECGPKCLCGDYCSNKRFQRKEYSDAEVFKTKQKGWGIRAKTALPAGAFICEYVGETLDQRQFKKRQKEYDRDGLQHHYFMALNNDEVIDATRRGNFTRFTNHSCDPNSETQKWTVGGYLRIGFFTLRAVAAGEELTFDYQFERYGKTAQICYCGSSNCRGTIGSVEDKKRPTRAGITDGKMAVEIDKLAMQGSLRTRADAVKMSQLLLRVDNDRDRITLLKLIQNSDRTNDNKSALSQFLFFQGYALLADMMRSVKNNPPEVKLEILNALDVFHFQAKNELISSKIWSILEEWAGREYSNPALPQQSSSIQAPVEPESDGIKLVDMESVSEGTSSGTVKSEMGSGGVSKDDAAKVKIKEENIKPEIKIEKDNCKVLVKEEDTQRGTNREENDEELATKKENVDDEMLVKGKAGELLDKWRDLKLLYKIPKRIMETAAAATVNNSQTRFQPLSSISDGASGSSIPTVGQQKKRSPSPLANGYFAYNKKPKYYNNYRPYHHHHPHHSRFSAPLVPANFYVENQAKKNAIPAENPEVLKAAAELKKKNEEILQHQISARLAMNKLPTGQKVQLLLPDGTVHDARTFKPTAEQAASISLSLPEVSSQLWEEKAQTILQRMTVDLTPVDAPVVEEIVGWTSNLELKGEIYLPEDWMPAYDRMGRLYFYNNKTGVSRWDFPTECREYSSTLQHLSSTVQIPQDFVEFDLVPEGEVEEAPASEPELDDEEEGVPNKSRSKSDPTLAISKISKKDQLKRIREEFQNDLCKYVLHVLNAYRSETCTQGRIESKDDFKVLARKFTHTVLEQEVKRHRHTPHLLKFSSSKHKPKIKEYVRKYMSRFGRVYKKEGREENNNDDEEDVNVDATPHDNGVDKDDEDEEEDVVVEAHS